MEVPPGHVPVTHGVGIQLGRDQRHGLVGGRVVRVPPLVQPVRHEPPREPRPAGRRGELHRELVGGGEVVNKPGGRHGHWPHADQPCCCESAVDRPGRADFHSVYARSCAAYEAVTSTPCAGLGVDDRATRRRDAGSTGAHMQRGYGQPRGTVAGLPFRTRPRPGRRPADSSADKGRSGCDSGVRLTPGPAAGGFVRRQGPLGLRLGRAAHARAGVSR